MPHSSTPLLSSNGGRLPQSPPKTLFTKLLFTILLLTAAVAISAAAAAVIFSTAPSINLRRKSVAKKLNKPVVILISADGFRFGYQFKTPTPNIQRLILEGSEAELGLIPVFPTKTFPNHYSIATGLYPARHGIVGDDGFTDPATGDKFKKDTVDPKWWLGEPIWETAAKNGLKALTYYWPGSEVPKGKWTCSDDDYCKKFAKAEKFDKRVEGVLKSFDNSNKADVPSLVALYFEDPDSQGHKVGPDDRNITAAISLIDQMVGKLIEGLKDREILDEVNIILVGDHGMVSNCVEKTVFLDDFSEWIEINSDWVETYFPVLGIRPKSTKLTPKNIVEQMNKAINSGKVKNGEYLKVYLKEDFPARLKYSGSDRIPPIVGLLDEGYKLEKNNKTMRHLCGGDHGYDNELFSMRSIFIARGPEIKEKEKVESFVNVEIYNFITKLLKIPAAENDGTAFLADRVLKRSR
ncbi:uncharacterized protein LOC127265095 [Andrographis paniculata]|uniref:uncharacterized protein LOC127265095 n=1 Tax=Andrographis paniculata TaxID=175694 RepID=UPI0021E89D17|nr:uncharacterized protein LOC127265095 [Andrographis paniculata]